MESREESNVKKVSETFDEVSALFDDQSPSKTLIQH